MLKLLLCVAAGTTHTPSRLRLLAAARLNYLLQTNQSFAAFPTMLVLAVLIKLSARLALGLAQCEWVGSDLFVCLCAFAIALETTEFV